MNKIKVNPHASYKRKRPFYRTTATIRGSILGVGQASHSLYSYCHETYTLHHMHNYTACHGDDELGEFEGRVEDPVYSTARLVKYTVDILDEDGFPLTSYTHGPDSRLDIMQDDPIDWNCFGYDDDENDLLHFGNEHGEGDGYLKVVVRLDLHRRLMGNWWVTHHASTAKVRYAIDLDIGFYFKYADED